MKAPDYILHIVVACAMTACTRPGDGHESGSDKAECSMLQVLEAEHRGSPIRNIEFNEMNGYHIVCVPGINNGERIWIMMDPKSPPYYKQIPGGNYLLTKEQIDVIRETTNPTSTALGVLESHQKATPGPK